MSVNRPVRARLATVALFVANGLGIGGWAACIPAVRDRLSLSDAQLGLALLAFAATAIVGMPAAGVLGARLGSHRVALAAGLLFAIGLGLPGCVPDLPWLIAVALPFGMGNGVLDVSMNAHATAVERAGGTPIMSSFHAAFSVGGLAGAASAGVLLAQGVPQWAVLGAIGLSVGGLVLTAALLGLTREVPPLPAASGAAFAWPSRELVGIGALTFLALLIEGAIADWSGVFLVTVTGATLSLGASGYAAFSVAMIACRLLGDRIVRMFGQVRVLRAGALLAVSGMALALGVAQPAAAMVGFCMVGLGLANMVPVLFSAAGRASSAGPSVGVAMAATLGYGGLLLGPPIIGLAADLAGLRAALLVLLAGGLVIASAAAAILPGRQSRARRLAT